MEEQQSEGHSVSDNEEEPVQPTNTDVTVTKSPKKGKKDCQKEERSPRTMSGVQSAAQTAQCSGKRKCHEQPETHTATEPTPLPKFIDDKARERKGKSHTDFISRVNSVNIELNPDIVNSVLETKIETFKFSSSNLEVITLFENLKQHILLLEDGLMTTMTSEQQVTFVAKRILLLPPIPPENEIAQRKEPKTEPTAETTPQYRASTSQSQYKGKAPATDGGIEEEDDDDEDEDTEEEDPAQFRLARRRPGFSKITF
ncbi:uncharacterized protein LOC113771527 [Coffea eugenioides]|uniref:uncharacterized protein LOC113771527 n=1 Tax=Coffea eugenioides TaxID=49369 RepID=UPI000F60E574|nr:uncharacterized protein LOC113771527 [Coffea eugenioides]